MELPAGDPPRWETHYQGRLRWELDALESVGITPEIDNDRWNSGLLALTFDWPLDATTTLRLKAVYPDSFPHMRPQVFLISGLDQLPVRHRGPMDNNLCLLGRNSSQWLPSWTLHKLLSEQLEDTVRGTGDEDPQGEPSEFWWNSLNRGGSFCLIDSAWDFGELREGTLLLKYINDGVKNEISAGNTRVPIIRAYVSQVRAMDDRVIHKWQGALPPDLAKADKNMRISWVRVDDTILPDPSIVPQVDTIRESHKVLRENIKFRRYQGDLMIDSFAVIHRSELDFGVNGLGWVIFLLFCQRKDCDKNRKSVTTLPVLRAGPSDIGYRVPAVETLHDKSVLIVGTGAVGAPVAIELARNGCKILHLIEHDTVEPGNTIRWPLGFNAWGKTKLDALNEFLSREYPDTKVYLHPHYLGLIGLTEAEAERSENGILGSVIVDVHLVIDGSASHGVTTLLADRCRDEGTPLISLFATPTLEGGVVVRYAEDGGCPNCLEYAWHDNNIPSPPGRDSEDSLVQPPGCAERTFIGAGYDLQELSLQAVRLSVDTLAEEAANESVIQTLSFVDEDNNRCPPRWRIDPLPKHPKCQCSG